MPPKISPKVATGPAPADESTLEAYQQTLLKLRRLSLQTTNGPTGHSSGPTTPGSAQSQSDPRSSNFPPSRFPLRRDGTSVSSSGGSSVRGNQTKTAISVPEDEEHEESEASDSEEDGIEDAREDEKRHEEEGSEDETEEEQQDEDEDEAEDDDEQEEYCTCRRPGFGNMVKCNNQGCRYEWFHASCVGITKKPTAPWFCKECKSRMKGKAKRMDEEGLRV